VNLHTVALCIVSGSVGKHLLHRGESSLVCVMFSLQSSEVWSVECTVCVYRKRMTARECLQHTWLAQHDEKMSCVRLSTDKLKKFIIRRKWQVCDKTVRQVECCVVCGRDCAL